MIRSSILPCWLSLLSGATLFFLASASQAATPLTKAKVTRVQNSVNFGTLKNGLADKRPANVADVIASHNYLFTETDSRAELQYEDGTLVRIGQNTVFSFDAESRTLNLDKGSFIFYMPKGAGGGTIKTASITAAITGTVGKVSENTIAILEGQVTLVPSGRIVREGQFARRNPDGTITIDFFDPATAFEGKLMNFAGAMPGVDQRIFNKQLPPNFNTFFTEDLDRANNGPSANTREFPAPKPKQEPKPKEKEKPTPTPRPKPTSGPCGTCGC